MRVIAGTCRSMPLKAPYGLNTRPTQDKTKETLFNCLQAYIPEGIFIDLFAGSGSIGIEALSRGAKHAYFVENNKEAISVINENLTFTKLSDKATVLRNDCVAALSLINEKEADVIFMDPPYDGGFEEAVFAALKNKSFVTKDTIIVLEASNEYDFSFEGFTEFKIKKYKNNKHIFYRRSDE